MSDTYRDQHEPAKHGNPLTDRLGTVRQLGNSLYMKLSTPESEPWHAIYSDGDQRYSGWQSNECMADCPEVGYAPLKECYQRSVTPDEVREAANAMLLVDIPVPMKMVRAAFRSAGLKVTE